MGKKIETKVDKSSVELKVEERKEVQRRTSPRAVVVHEAIRREGEAEIKRPSSALAWSGLAAGLSMGFSLVTEGLLQSSLPDAPWRPLISKFGYSIGFLIVILGRQQLFTENTLTPILPLLQQRSLPIFAQVLRLWAVVLAANVAGAALFAWVIGHTSLFDPAVREVFTEIGMEKMSDHFSTTVLSGIFAGWLIALTVWLLPFAETGRVIVIIVITYIIGLGSFHHIIAGSVEMLYLVGIGAISLKIFFTGFFLPTLIGNIIGGVSLVAAINHAQVVAGGMGE